MAGLQADRDIVAGLAEAKHAEYELEKKGLSPAASSHEQELDGIHDGLEFPTEEEKHTLRRVPDQVPWSAYCEHPLPQFATYVPRSHAVQLHSNCSLRACGALLILRYHRRLREYPLLRSSTRCPGTHEPQVISRIVPSSYIAYICTHICLRSRSCVTVVPVQRSASRLAHVCAMIRGALSHLSPTFDLSC